MSSRNLFIDARSKHEIDQIVDRVHDDLSIKNDLVVLEDVRALLKLDLQYYVSSDPSLLQEVVHKLRLGKRQLVTAPARLFDVVTKFGLTGLFVPERRRILLDEQIPNAKKRWAESHEITHSLLPWHQEYMLGDTLDTITPECHDIIESEANYGAGRLLYPHESLAAISAAAPPSMSHVKVIAKHFNNTITSALWRYVEIAERPTLGIIGAHPRYADSDSDIVTHFVRSPSFAIEFANIDDMTVIAALKSFCAFRKRGPLGTAEVILTDANGNDHIFVADSFSNNYDVLTLISYSCKSNLTLAVKTV